MARPNKYAPTAGIDRLIEEAYDRYLRANDRKAIRKGAQVVGWPGYAFRRRAAELGLARIMEKRWSDEELEILSQGEHLTCTSISRRLARAGFRRSAGAVHVKRSRTPGRATPYRNTWSPAWLAKLLGCDPHLVMSWVRMGWLEASPRGTDRTPQQGGDDHIVTIGALRKFVATYPEKIDHRKVDFPWLVWVLVTEII